MKKRSDIPYNKHIWTEQEESFLIDNYQKMTNRELAKSLGLTLTLTRTKLYEMGFKRMELEYWTEEQVKYLLEHYTSIGDLELAEIFQEKWPKQKVWTKKHIEKKRKYLKLKRSSEQLADIKQRNVDAGRFIICAVKRWEKTGKAAEGEIRYWREHTGRMVPRIKINGKFIHWCRYRYEQLYGAIPEGMNIVFRDNDPRNLSDDNIMAITDGELSRRNSIRSSQGLSDNYVAGVLTHGDPETRKIIKNMPHLIELKRNQLILNRAINNGTNKNRK